MSRATTLMPTTAKPTYCFTLHCLIFCSTFPIVIPSATKLTHSSQIIPAPFTPHLRGAGETSMIGTSSFRPCGFAVALSLKFTSGFCVSKAWTLHNKDSATPLIGRPLRYPRLHIRSASVNIHAGFGPRVARTLPACLSRCFRWHSIIFSQPVPDNPSAIVRRTTLNPASGCCSSAVRIASWRQNSPALAMSCRLLIASSSFQLTAARQSRNFASLPPIRPPLIRRDTGNPLRHSGHSPHARTPAQNS